MFSFVFSRRALTRLPLVVLAAFGIESAHAQAGLEVVAETGTTSNGVIVDYAAYPLPAYEGRPWSQWGKGIVASNGKVYSAVGDHHGINGNSYVYEYDPETKTLRLTADLQSAVEGFQPTDYGFGKVHGRINEGADGFLYFASYWGTTRSDENYVGDRFFRYDPGTDALTDLGVPAQGYGFPSTNLWAEGLIFYAEAFEKQSTPYNVSFLAYDLVNQQVTFFGGHEGSRYGRAFFVDAEGSAYFNNGGASLVKYDPRTSELTPVAGAMPGSNLRQVTRPDANGSMYATAEDTLQLFRFDPGSGEFTTITALERDTAAMDLDPTGRYLYYTPGSHNRYGNNPLIQLDLSTGEKRIITTLQDYIAPTYGHNLGGSYNLTVSPDGRVVYLGINGDKDGNTGFDDPAFIAVHIPDDASTAFGFQDVAADAGLDALIGGQYLHAAAWGDVNGDGYPDLFTGAFNNAFGTEGPNRLLINNGGAGFTESAQGALNIADARSAGAAFADFDNDGDLDLILVTNYRNSVPSLNRLYRNDGSGSFDDVTAGSNVDIPGFSGRNAFVLDYDGDGWLDLFLQEDMFGPAPRSSRLMRNSGGLVFEDVTESSNLPSDLVGLGGAVGDFNGDGYPDLFVAASRGPGLQLTDNRLYLNNGDGTFREYDNAVFNVAADWNIRPGDDWPAGAALGDLDNDGDLDLVVGQHKESALKHANNGAHPGQVRVYLNHGNGESGDPIFEDVTNNAGIIGIYAKQPHVEIQDMDNDGSMDIVTSAVLGLDGDPSRLQPVIYRNTLGTSGALFFELPPGMDPATWVDWLNPQQPGPINPRYFPGAPVADFNLDGKLDLFGQEALQTGVYFSPLFQNVSESGNNFLDVRVLTSDVNIRGVGARVQIFEPGGAGDPSRLIGAAEISVGNGFSSGTPAIAHFGVAGRESVDVVVSMPFGGPVHTASGVATNQVVVLPGGSTGVPAAPINLVATVASSSQIDLTWTDNSGNEDRFEIWLVIDGWEYVGEVAPNVTSYNHTGLVPGTTYLYTVWGFNAAGYSDSSNEASATTDP